MDNLIPFATPINIQHNSTISNNGAGSKHRNGDGGEQGVSEQQNRVLYSIYLVRNYNDGKSIPPYKLERALDQIANYAGGATVLPTSDGLWVGDTGQVFHDSVLPILTVAPGTAETEQFFCQLAGELAKLLGQQEIFIHRMPVSLIESVPTTIHR